MRTMAVILTLLAAGPGSIAAVAALPAFRVEQISDALSVGYAVQLVDMNDDGRLDIVVVDTQRVVWFENPTWQLHTLVAGQTKKDNVSIAPADIDGDGKLDFALAADWRPSDTRASGSLQWLKRPASPGESWTVHPIGSEPTIHRIRFADIDGDGRQELVVVPLFGRGTTGPNFAEAPLRILAYEIPDDPLKGRWTPQVINAELHVAHNFYPTDLDRDGQLDILVASFEGVSLLARDAGGAWKRTLIGSGNQETAPSKGASEIKHGRLAGGADYLATIEPWHGFQVAVYTRPDDVKAASATPRLWRRQVLDDQLKWGHAVWCANLDDDGDDELVIGVRDNKDADHPCGLRIYDPAAADGTKWTKHVVDPGGVAIEDLTVGDLDGDGDADIVAVGRQTKNVRVYWNTKDAGAKGAAAPPPKKRDPALPQVYAHPITVSGTALDPAGQPLAGARVYIASCAGGWRRVAETASDDQGRYEFPGVLLPIEKGQDNIGADHGAFELFGQAPGCGFAWRPRKWFYPQQKFALANPASFAPDPPDCFGTEDKIELDLSFSPPACLKGRIVDDAGNPIPDTWLAIRDCEPLGGSRSHVGLEFESLNKIDTVPPGMKLRVTDAAGRFEFTELPADCRFRIDVRPRDFASRWVWAATTDVAQPALDGSPVFTGELKLVFPRPFDIPFRVVFGDSGEPAVRARLGAYNREAGASATTDSQGRASLRLPPGEYLIETLPSRGTPYLVTNEKVTIGKSPLDGPVIARLRPAAVIDITVRDAETGRGLAGVDLWQEVLDDPAAERRRDLLFFRSWEVETRIAWVERPRTDENGRMRALVEPRRHRIGVGMQAFPRGYAAVREDGEEVDLRPGQTVQLEFTMRKGP